MGRKVIRFGTMFGSVCERCGDTTIVCECDGTKFECCETCGHEQNVQGGKK
jgi:hypothetical protein